jgi:O-antigen/teichoic acid export membrane protein
MTSSEFMTLWQRACQMKSVLQLTPFDLSTDEGRSRERYRRIALTTLATFAAKGFALLASLITVPLTLNYLGTERYGLWMTISSVIAMLGFADLGLGNGLISALAEADGKNDRAAARRYVSSSLMMLAFVAALILLAFAVVYPLIPWAQVFNVASPRAAHEVGPTVIGLVVCFALGLPLLLIQRVQSGYQEGFASGLWQSAGSLLSLGCVLLAIRAQAGLAWLALALTGAPLLVAGLNWIVYAGWQRPEIFPRWSDVQSGIARRLAATGSVFLWLQALTLIGTTSDSLIIAHTYGAHEVSVYAVVQRLFSITLIVQLLVAPLWPAFGEAMAREDYAWIRRTLNRSLKLCVGVTTLAVLPMIFWGRQIIPLWTGQDLKPPFALMLGFGAWMIMGSYAGNLAALFNSGPLLRHQVVFYTVASVVALILKIVLAVTWQPAGVVWATVAGYGLFFLLPADRIARRLLGSPNPQARSLRQ